VSLADGLKLARTDGTVQTLTDPDGSLWAVSPTDHQLVLATRTGQVYLADTLRLHTSQRTTLCRDAVIGIVAAGAPRSATGPATEDVR